jgi:hypothetical protein
VIMGPPVTNDVPCENHRIIPAEDGALGFVVYIVFSSLPKVAEEC